jgi:exodeoxyribonuclease-3
MIKIATWNVNSIKIRLAQVIEFLKKHEPDILSLQEIKVDDSHFPVEEILATGYQVTFNGQKSYNGVATLSRQPATEIIKILPGVEDEQKRLLMTTIQNVRVINVYIPNGQSLGSEKFVYKLNWYDALCKLVQVENQKYENLVLLGDLNVAPQPEDVHNPFLWEGQIHFSEPERAAFANLLNCGLQDSFRLFEQPEKSFTWWDYRMLAFRRNHGLRIDHILVNKNLASKCLSCIIDKEFRKSERPSDHAPVIATFAL